MQYVSYVAKALTAAAVGFLAAVAQYNLDVEPWVMVVVSTIIAGLAVFLVPNGTEPVENSYGHYSPEEPE